ncbi:hypothetical protein [Nitrosomonas communis]|nr:hypothetical protein [Nitrosomonas communis]
MSSHAAMMAEDENGNKAEARPPVELGRMKLAGYAGFGGLSNE